MGLTTEEILQAALVMSDFPEAPADTAIYVPGRNLRRGLAGIDMGLPELLLARETGFDVVIGHHPQGGRALLDFPDVLGRHVELMRAHGVPEPAARGAVADLIHEARCNAHRANHDRDPSAARLLGMPYLNIHLPLDEIGRRRLVEALADVGERTPLRDLCGILAARLPELAHAPTEIDIRVGSPEGRAGRIAVIHGAGTNGGYPVARALYEHGVDTVVYIHCSGPDSRRLRDEFGDRGKNLLVTGHMASDSLGFNPFLDELERRGLEVQPMSGIVRIRHAAD